MAAGGRHEGMGTHNRIVPLGGGYLELLAVADADEAAGSPLGAAVAGRIETVGEGLLGYAVAVDDVRTAAARLGVAVSTITRSGFTGTLAGVADAMREPCLPFFVQRRATSRTPGPARRPAGSPGWRSPATPRGWRAGWTGRTCRSASPRASRPCERWASAAIGWLERTAQ